jgi:hypothetical protein
MINTVGFAVDLEKIATAGDRLPTYLVRAAKELQESTFLTAGDFFERLEDVEVLHLAVLMNTIRSTQSSGEYMADTVEAQQFLYWLSLLCFILALGEGTVEMTPELLQECLMALFLLIAVENLYRRGKVEVFRENFSVLESFKPIARDISGGSNEDFTRT